MTMKVKIENLGPEIYTTVVSVREINGIVSTEELTMGQSAEYTIWQGRNILVSERDAN